jgi:hypothetical protein
MLVATWLTLLLRNDATTRRLEHLILENPIDKRADQVESSDGIIDNADTFR